MGISARPATAETVELRVKNRTGRVSVLAEEGSKRVSIRASSAAGLAVTERDVRVTNAAGAIQIEVERRPEKSELRIRRDPRELVTLLLSARSS